MEGWYPGKRFNHTSCVTVVTQTDRPKSARSRCVIGFFVAFLFLGCYIAFLKFSVDVGVFVIELSLPFFYEYLRMELSIWELVFENVIRIHTELSISYEG